MSLSELEYIVLKEESLIDYKDTSAVNSTGTEFDETIEPQNRKCGEILVNENDTFTFWCVFCSKASFVEISEFFEHFEQYHMKSLRIVQKFDPLEPNDSDGYERIKIEPVENETESTHMECTSNQKVADNDPDVIVLDKEVITSINLYKDSKNKNSDKPDKKEQNVSSIHAKAFKCDICNRKYALKSSLKRHQKTHPEYGADLDINRDSILNCEECNRQFTSQKVLDKHKMCDHQPIDPFVSPMEIQKQPDVSSDDDGDDLSTVRKNGNSPSLLFTQEIEDPMKCRYCDRKFNARTKRIEHERIHTGERPFKCELCGKCFRSLMYLKKHDMIHKGIKPHKCSMCEAAFTEKSNLQQHIRRHLGDKKIPCTFCGKLFQQNSERKIHERIHTGEKPFQCSVCGKCFTTSEKVGRHIVRHQNIRPFKCDECNRCFYSRRELCEHRVVHTGEKPYICNICNAAFPRRKALKSHEKIHSDVAEYICTICGKGFKQNPGLYCHMKSHGISTKSCRTAENINN